MRTRLRKNPDGLYLALMLTLTFSTGVIDAVGYLGLDRVFTANMTGNVVILGMGLTGADDLPIIGPAVALFAFMLGALVAGRTLRAKKAGWMTRTTVLFVVVAVIVGGASVLAFATEGDRPEIVAHVITGLLGVGMGVQAGAARHIAVKDVTTVVVTSTLVGLAFDSRLGGRAKQQWARRLLAVVFIGGGAAVGALLLDFGLGTGMAVTAGIVMLVALIGQIGKPAPAPAEVVEDPQIVKA